MNDCCNKMLRDLRLDTEYSASFMIHQMSMSQADAMRVKQYVPKTSDIPFWELFQGEFWLVSRRFAKYDKQVMHAYWRGKPVTWICYPQTPGFLDAARRWNAKSPLFVHVYGVCTQPESAVVVERMHSSLLTVKNTLAPEVRIMIARKLVLGLQEVHRSGFVAGRHMIRATNVLFGATPEVVKWNVADMLAHTNDNNSNSNSTQKDDTVFLGILFRQHLLYGGGWDRLTLDMILRPITLVDVLLRLVLL